MSIHIVVSKPCHSMSFEPSPVPVVHQERQRLLLAMKHAQDVHELQASAAEHHGYVRGLFMGMQISSATLVLFQREANRICATSATRLLDGETTFSGQVAQLQNL